MADNEYVIILKNDTSGGTASSPVAGDNTRNDSAVAKSSSSKKKDGNALTASLVAWQKVKPFVNTVVSHEINMVQVETGATEYTQKLQFAQQVAGSAIGTVESMLMGLAVGGLPGALVGLATDLIAKSVNIAIKQDEINRLSVSEQKSINLNVIRSGTFGSRGAKK